MTLVTESRIELRPTDFEARSGSEGEVGALGIGTYWFARIVYEITVRPRPASPGQPTNVETDHPPEGAHSHAVQLSPGRCLRPRPGPCQYAVQRAAALTDSPPCRPLGGRSPVDDGSGRQWVRRGRRRRGDRLGRRGVRCGRLGRRLAWATVARGGRGGRAGRRRDSGRRGDRSARRGRRVRRGRPSSRGSGAARRGRGPGRGDAGGPIGRAHRHGDDGVPGRAPLPTRPATPAGVSSTTSRSRSRRGRVGRAAGQHRHHGDSEEPTPCDAERLQDVGVRFGGPVSGHHGARPLLPWRAL